jgi:peptide/nickel transport system substrate-binding protein
MANKRAVPGRPAKQPLLACLLASLVVSACAGPGGQSRGAASQEAPGGFKRIVAAVQGDPHTLYQKFNPSSRVPGIENLELLVNAGLGVTNDSAALVPQLAELIPSVENGMWRVLPDGRMETSWRLRPGVRWHDGEPFTTQDLVFTLQVARDKELEVLADRMYDSIVAVDAADAQTILVRWASPRIDADTLFTPDAAMPIPKHLLERVYLDDKSKLLEHAFWTEQFVGLGPFKVQEFARGSHLTLVANDAYALGRPRIDQIDVKFIPDQNALIANVLAGSVELTLSRGLSVEQALQVRDLWGDGGQIAVKFVNWVAVWPQFVNPNPQVVADARFRQALLHAMDRQEMADVIQAGLVPVAHVIINPTDPVYAEIQGSIVRYDYDPRRAAQVIDSLGYAKAADGLYRDAAGERLEVELRTSATRDVSNKSVLAIGDFWQRAGVTTAVSITPAALARDAEYRVSFPGFELAQNPNTVMGLDGYGPDPTGALRKGRNSYRHPDFDGAIGRLFVTVSAPERIPILRQIVSHMTGNATVMGIFYGADPFLIGKRLSYVSPGNQEARMAWNAQLWDVR